MSNFKSKWVLLSCFFIFTDFDMNDASILTRSSYVEGFSLITESSRVYFVSDK